MPPIIDTIERELIIKFAEYAYRKANPKGKMDCPSIVYEQVEKDFSGYLHTALLRAYQEGQKEGYTRGWDNGERHELEASVSGEVVIAKEKVAQIRKSEREALIQEVIEKAEGMKSHNSHISPIDSGYNNALSDLIASLKK